MVAVDNHAAIINDTGRRAKVSPFTTDYESLSQVPIVDVAIRCAFPYSRDAFLMIVRSNLNTTCMNHNLIPPLAMREVGGA